MPLIRIENYPSGMREKFDPWELAASLQEACLAANVPGLDCANKITVVAGGVQLLRENKVLLVIVEYLFLRSDRPKEVRDRLALNLARCAERHVPLNWKVEVLISRFDPEVDSYVVLEKKRP